MPKEDFQFQTRFKTKPLRVAVLLRGIHYKEGYTCQWSGRPNRKKDDPGRHPHTVDFERVFASTFEKAVLNNLNSYDIFVCTYPSPNQEAFLERYKPVDSLFIGEDDRFGYKHNQCRGFQAGLEMIEEYSKKKHKKYDMVMCTRSDIGYGENFLEGIPLDEERMLAFYQWKFVKEWLSLGAPAPATLHIGIGCHDFFHLFPYKIIGDVISGASNVAEHDPDALHALPHFLDPSLVHIVTHPDDYLWRRGNSDRWLFARRG